MSDPVARLNAALEGRYSIERELGEGGMATVYLAEDVRHHRKVALKVLRPDLAATLGPERFLREIEIAAGLTHPHIVPLHDSGEADGFLFYVLPYIEGESLRDRLVREGELPITEAIRILRDVVDGLAHAHDHGVVHRDIKPDNVMLSGRHALVTDFGVAKAVSEATGRHQLTTVGVALGTPAYMSPEQAEAADHIDHRADIYAVGALGYELLAGAPPFSGKSPQMTLVAHVTQAPKPVTEHRSSVPPALAHLVMRCLEKKPADRWQSAEEMLEHLEGLATPSGGLTPTHVQPATTSVEVGGGTPTWLKVAVPLAVAGIALLAWTALSGPPGESADVPGVATTAEDAPERLVVIPLENLTTDPEMDVWGQLAADWMARAIDGPRPLPVIPSTTVRDAVRELGEAAGLTAVAERTGATYAVAGTVARTGDQVRFEVGFVDVRDGTRLRDLPPVTAPLDSVEAAVGRLAEMAAAQAVALFDPNASARVQGVSVPPSLSAYQDYLNQAELFCQARYTEAIAVGERILADYPDYIPALQFNGIAYNNSSRDVQADSVRRLLDGLRAGMTSFERFIHDWVAAYYDGDLETAYRISQGAYRQTPSSVAGPAAQSALFIGFFEESLRIMREGLAVDDPCADFSVVWATVSGAYHLLGDYQGELEWARAELEDAPNHRLLMDREIRALSGLGRQDAVDSILALMDELPPQPGYPMETRLRLAALELGAHGHTGPAAAVAQRAAEWYEDQPAEEALNDRAQAFYVAGRYAEAELIFAALVEGAPRVWNPLGRWGVTLSRMGRVEDAMEVYARLEALDELNMGARNLKWMAAIESVLGNRDRAVGLLARAKQGGQPYAIEFHSDPHWEPLWGYPPFEALFAPRN